MMKTVMEAVLVMTISDCHANTSIINMCIMDNYSYPSHKVQSVSLINIIVINTNFFVFFVNFIVLSQ